jgi:predicted secreted protein
MPVVMGNWAMTLAFALAIYFIIWWLVLFMVLPIGMRTQGEAGEIVPGTPASAPATPRLLRVLLITTIIASIVFVLVYQVLETPELRSMVGGWFGL